MGTAKGNRHILYRVFSLHRSDTFGSRRSGASFVPQVYGRSFRIDDISIFCIDECSLDSKERIRASSGDTSVRCLFRASDCLSNDDLDY